MVTNLLNTGLQYLERHPTQNMYGRELVGDVVPHIAIARTTDERVDTSVIQLTNTFLPVIAGYSLDKIFDKLQPLIQPVETVLAKNWYHLGKSMAIFGFLATIPVANAFIRNWVTTKRSGTTGFIDMVGEKSSSTAQKQHVKETLKTYSQNITKLLGAGAVVSGILFGLTQLPIRGKWAFGKLPQLIKDYFSLSGGKFENFAKPAKKLFKTVSLPPVLIWGIPIYTGLFSASRDQFEFKELVLRFATFLTSFFILPQLAKDAMEKRAPEFLKKTLGNAKNAGIVTEFITTSILFAVLPPLVNIYLTKQRVKREEQQESPAQHKFPNIAQLNPSGKPTIFSNFQKQYSA